MCIHVFQKNVFYQGLFARFETGWIGFNWEIPEFLWNIIVSTWTSRLKEPSLEYRAGSPMPGGLMPVGSRCQ